MFSHILLLFFSYHLYLKQVIIHYFYLKIFFRAAIFFIFVAFEQKILISLTCYTENFKYG